MELHQKIRKIIREAISKDTLGVPENVWVFPDRSEHAWPNDFYVEHHLGNKLASWLGGVYKGKLIVLSSDYFTEHRISEEAPKTKEEAVKRILQWYKKLDDIEIGKIEKFPGGITAEQSISEGDGKMWVFTDEKGRILAKYYPYLDHMELDPEVFSKIEREGGGKALYKMKIGGLKNAAFTIFAELVKINNVNPKNQGV